MTTRLRDLLLGLRDLKLKDAPVIVHSSLSSFGEVEGGAGTVVSALGAVFGTILVPAFTYKTMVTPIVGPPDNGIQYGTGADLNRMAEFFSPKMPVDPLIGVIPETMRRHPNAERSNHPILSFTGLNARDLLKSQSITHPLAPLEELEKKNGWVILIGVDHSVNTSIHCGEKLAGRRTFIRWALTPRGVVECPEFPGCSAGFESLAPMLDRYTRFVSVGKTSVKAIPLTMLFKVVISLVEHDPLALLCSEAGCERCTAVRELFYKGKNL